MLSSLTEQSISNGRSNYNTNSRPSQPQQNWKVLTVPRDVEAGDKVSVTWEKGLDFGITFQQSCHKGEKILVVAPDASPPALPSISVRPKKTSNRNRSSTNLKRKRNNDDLLSQKQKDSIYADAFRATLWPFMCNKGWVEIKNGGDGNDTNGENGQDSKYNGSKNSFIPPASYRVKVTTTNNGGTPKKGIVRGVKNVIEFIKISSEYDQIMQKFSDHVKTKIGEAVAETRKSRRATRHSMRLYTWKYCGKLYPKKQSSVGDNYQVTDLPQAGSFIKELDEEKW